MTLGVSDRQYIATFCNLSVTCTVTTEQPTKQGCVIIIETEQYSKQFTEQMEIPELLTRYNLNSRTALYNRRKTLGLEFSKGKNDRAFATKEQVAMLDDLHRHLEHGGRLSNYSPVYDVHVISATTVNSSPNNEQFTEQ